MCADPDDLEDGEQDECPFDCAPDGPDGGGHEPDRGDWGDYDVSYEWDAAAEQAGA